MLNKHSLLITLVVCASVVTTALGSDVKTLFTTPQERQLINNNRYESGEAQPQRQLNQEESSTVEIKQTIKEIVRESITVSGITLSNSGPNMVWINGQTYEDGEKIDDKMRIKIMTGSEIKVRITAPDGKHYFATSGETIEIVYQAAVEN
ncbi:MAG: hypothetical protein ACI9CO_002013 [Candidatus Azotimanducaceae bacterium]|jgi:hypothetical protein